MQEQKISHDQAATLEFLCSSHTDIAQRIFVGLKITSFEFMPKDRYFDALSYIQNQKQLLIEMGMNK